MKIKNRNGAGQDVEHELTINALEGLEALVDLMGVVEFDMTDYDDEFENIRQGIKIEIARAQNNLARLTRARERLDKLNRRIKELEENEQDERDA